MARIAGIKTEKDHKGNLKSVTFDIKRHGARIMPVLIEMGAIEEDEFEKEWKEAQKTGYTVEGAFKELESRINARWETRK